MKAENVRKFKGLFDNDPEAARAAETAAIAELAEIEARGITPKNLDRAEYLMDLCEFIKAPVGVRSVDGGFGYAGGNTYGGEQRAFDTKFGEFLQAVFCAGQGVDAGRKVGRFETGQVYRDVLMHETRATGLAEAVPSLGGFLVGTDVSETLFQKAYQSSLIWNKTRQFTVSGNNNGLRIPGISESSRANGSRQGGVTSYWLEEAGSKTASKPTFRAIELNLNKIIGLNIQGPSAGNGADKCSQIRGTLKVA